MRDMMPNPLSTRVTLEMTTLMMICEGGEEEEEDGDLSLPVNKI